jgi:hypothetical protein
MDAVLQIADNLLAFSYAVNETRILIWDWTTAELLLVRDTFSAGYNLFNDERME